MAQFCYSMSPVLHDKRSNTNRTRFSHNPLLHSAQAIRRHAPRAHNSIRNAKHHTQGTTPPAVGHSTTLECVTRCLTFSAIYPSRSYRHQTALSPTSATAYLGLCICIECVFATAEMPYIYIMHTHPRNIGTTRHPRMTYSENQSTGLGCSELHDAFHTSKKQSLGAH